MTTISFRIAIFAHGTTASIDKAIDYSQVANLVFSLITNITATSVIASKVWYVVQSCDDTGQHKLSDMHRRQRQWVRKEMGIARTKNTRGEKIMILLIESGLFYCVSGVSRHDEHRAGHSLNNR